MAGFFYNLGQQAGPKLRKGKWFWMSATGTEEEILDAERDVGTDLAAQFAHQLGLDPDVQLQAWTRRIGQSLGQLTREKQRQWDFLVSAEGEPNAFALPGGYIFIARSLIELVNGDPGEVAFILGHEIAHVVKRHPMRRIVSDAGIATAMKAMPRLARLPGGKIAHAAGAVSKIPGMPQLPDVSQAQGWLTDQLADLLRANYSQEDELYADKLGARLAQAAGYDADAGPRMLGRLAEQTRSQPASPLAVYFASHPPLDQRIDTLRTYLKSKK
ncbi:MAG: M48 family metallopeptidase [Planctomycetota bacterium]|jgi:predicted Zn-dependent protease